MNKIGSALDTSHWYLVQLKPNGQNVAITNLTRQGIRVFHPHHRTSQRRGQRFIEVTAPLFPGYLFVKLDTSPPHFRSVNGTLGVAKLVSFGDTPRALPRGLMTELMSRCDPDGFLKPQVDLPEGTEVKIISGPFSQFMARVAAARPGERVWIILDLMGHETRVAVDRSNLLLA